MTLLHESLSLWSPSGVDGSLNFPSIRDTSLRHPPGYLGRPLTYFARYGHLVFEALKVGAVYAAIFATAPAVEFVEDCRDLCRDPVRVPDVLVRELIRIQDMRRIRTATGNDAQAVSTQHAHMPIRRLERLRS